MNTGDDELRPEQFRATKLARQVLRATVAGNNDEARKILDTLNRDYAGEGMCLAILTWVDIVINRAMLTLPDSDGDVFGLEFEHADTGVRGSADDVPPETAWAGRIIIARMAMDKPMFDALMSALPTDPAGVGRYISTLLTVCSATLRHDTDTHPESPDVPAPPSGHTWN